MSQPDDRPTRSWTFVSATLVVAALCGALGVYLGNRVLAPATGDAPVSVQVRPVPHPASAGARLPRLIRHPEGGFLLSWVETDAQGHALKFAHYKSGLWTAPTEVARGDNWFINWIDFPSVVPIDNDFWVAHWLVRRDGAGRYDYDIALAISTDGGRAWGHAMRPYRNENAAEYGFVAIAANAGAADIVWLDGRDYVKPGERAKHPDKSGNFTLRHARVTRDGRIAPDVVVDPNVCTCCQTAAAGTPEGPVVAYRNRTDSEIRDNRLVLLRGDTWRPSSALGTEGWEIAGCPTNGPALAARGNRLASAWFTGEGNRPRVRAAISPDGGLTLGEIFDVDDNAPVGRIGTDWLDDAHAVVSWIGRPEGGTLSAPLLLHLIAHDGRAHRRMELARISSARDSGIPQVLVDGSSVYLAWTDSGPGFGIRLVTVEAANLLSKGR